MAIVEKVCIQSYTAPQNLELKRCLPHNFLYDLPLQSRDVSKEIDVFGSPPCFQPIKLSSSMTLPVFQPNNFDFSDLQKDPLQCIIQEKEEYFYKLRAYLAMAEKRKQKDPNFMKNVEISTRKTFFLDQHMLRLTDIITQDPHPYFSEPYIWLPVGGSIKNVSIGNKLYVVSPDGVKFDQIRAFPVAQNYSWEESGPTTTADCSPGGRIFQLVSCNQKKRGYVGVRQLQRFHVFGLKPSGEDGSLKAKKLIDVSQSSVPLVALDISAHNGVRACTIDKSNTVKVYDIDAGRCTVDNKVYETSETISNKKENDAEGKFIQFSKQPFMMYIINERKLFLKDIREPFRTSGTTFNVYDLSNGCENLSVSAESVVSDALYCSSTHHSFSLDPRRGWVKRWNHGLDNTPVFIDVGLVDRTEELVVTGTIAMGSTTGILHSWKENEGGICQSFCSYPAKMPSVRDTAFWANSNGYWLEPSIIKRTELSLIGMTMVSNADGQGCSLFSSNAIGDVFCTTFQPNESTGQWETGFFPHNTLEACSGLGAQSIQKWQEEHMQMISKGQMNLHCETLTDRSYLRNIMKQHLNKDMVARNHVRKWKLAIGKKEPRRRTRRKTAVDKPLSESNLRSLTQYNDNLSSEILSEWNMDLLIQHARTYNPEGPSMIMVDSDDSS